MTNEQIRYDKAGKEKVYNWIKLNKTNWNVQESDWKVDPIDITITNSTNENYVRYCEIKGREVAHNKYNDLCIDIKKIDFLNERVSQLKKYGGNRYNVQALVFYIWDDDVMAIVSTEVIANKGRRVTKDCRKSKADSTITTKQQYEMNLFNPDGSTNSDILLFDLKTNKPILKKSI